MGRIKGDTLWAMRYSLWCFLAIALLSIGWAAKDRNWQIGKIADLQADQQPSPGKGVLNRSVNRESEVRIVGEIYEYIAYDSTTADAGLLGRTLANRKHGCRFIVNDEVKYSQEKKTLYVLDADGKECKLDILRQERLPK